MRFFSRLPIQFSPPGFWPGLSCALLVFGAANLGWMTGLEGVTLDVLFRARGPRDADPRVVVVAIDDATVVRAGERTGVGWPLPRSYYARAARELKRLGAKVVAFDVLFAEPGADAKADALLARECRAAGNVVQACAFQVPDQSVELSSHLAAAPLPRRFAIGGTKSGGALDLAEKRRAIWATAPLPSLVAGARGLGHVNAFPDHSGTLRRAPHLLFWRGEMFPSLSLASAAQFLDAAPKIDARARTIGLAGRQIPLDSDGFTLVNWIGAGDSYPKWSLNQLLDRKIPQDAIRGRVVILGVTALGAFENRSTPFASGVAAVDFQANALDDILSNRLLKPIAAPYATLLLLGFSLWCAGVTARRGGNRAWPVLISMFLLMVAAVFALHRDIYLPIAAPLVGGALAFCSVAALGYRREWEAVMHLDSATHSLARGAARLGTALGASERDEAQLIEIIRATALQTLGAREVWVVLDDSAPNSSRSGADARAILGARIAQDAGQPWIFPRARNRQFKGDQRAQFRRQTAILRGQTLIAAPLPRATAESPAAAPSIPASRREFGGALVALGKRDGSVFGARDAHMLETLAESAALALENFRYSNALRGRIESADRQLESAYQLLAEQSAKLFAAVESIAAAIVVCDPRGDAAFVNAAAAEILRAATPAPGQNVARALANGDLREWAAWFDELAPATSPPSFDRFAAQRGEIGRGAQILSAQFTPLRGEGAEFLGAMIVVADISAQRELERMKTDFVGVVAHELRTPLTTILGYTSLLEAQAARFSPEQTRDMTQIISRHCRRMNAMISDLLDISRLESGQPLPIRREKFDLVALCQRLVAEQKTYLNPTPPLQIELIHAAPTLLFNGDSDRIEQVLLNLLSNAVKYSPGGGKITLSLAQIPGKIEVSVADEGMGLTRNQLAQMFQKFYRTEDSRARGIKGNGLGLNLVKQIVEAHGGQISAFSRRDEGEIGTTFHITLPA